VRATGAQHTRWLFTLPHGVVVVVIYSGRVERVLSNRELE